MGLKDNEIGFIQGIIFACAFLADDHDQPSMAIEIWDAAGYTNKDARYASEFDVARFRKAIPALPKGMV